MSEDGPRILKCTCGSTRIHISRFFEARITYWQEGSEIKWMSSDHDSPWVRYEALCDTCNRKWVPRKYSDALIMEAD